MISKLRLFLLSNDGLGPMPEFVHKGSQRYTTWLGLGLTIVIYAFTIVNVVPLVVSFIFGYDPSINSDYDYILKDNFLMTKNNLKLYIQFQTYDETSKFYHTLTDEEVKSIIFTNGAYSFPKVLFRNNTNNNVLPETSLTFCDIGFFKDYNLYQEYWNKNLSLLQIKAKVQGALCLPDEFKYNITRGIDTFSEVKIEISNLLFVNKDKVMYKNLFAVINYQQFYYSTFNNRRDLIYFTNYTNKIWTQEKIHINPGFNNYYDLTMNLHNFTLNSQINSLFTTTQELIPVHAFRQLSYDFSIPSNSFESSIILTINMSTRIDLISATYIGLNDIADRMGGQLSVMILLCGSIIEFLTKPFFTASLLNDTFRFHSSTYKTPEILTFVKNSKAFLSSPTCSPKRDHRLDPNQHIQNFNLEENIKIMTLNPISPEKNKLNNYGEDAALEADGIEYLDQKGNIK